MKKLKVNKAKDCYFRLGEPLQSTVGLARLSLPFPMVIAWAPHIIINSFLVHPIIHNPLEKVYSQILDCYGPGLIKSLNIDQYGGCYNFRLKRGSSKPSPSNTSSHSWAIAVDHDPVNNRYRWRADKAAFAKTD